MANDLFAENRGKASYLGIGFVPATFWMPAARDTLRLLQGVPTNPSAKTRRNRNVVV